VYGHDGKATNVTMEPGDMVLYESHSVLHGRPFPLKGRFYANIFIHFEPTGHSLRHQAKLEKDHGKNVDEKYKLATDRGIGGHEVDQAHPSDLPPYIIPGTPEERNWRRYHPGGFVSIGLCEFLKFANLARGSSRFGLMQKPKIDKRSFATGSTSIHILAQSGDLEGVTKAVSKNKKEVHAKDQNGWTALHEGARAGHTEIVKYLYEQGADVNARTGLGNGGSVMWWAKRNLGKDHPVLDFLESVGAQVIEPEL